MKRLIPFALVLAATACGSTGTDSSGAGDDDDDGSAITCASVAVVAPVTCADIGGKATFGVLTGDAAGTVAAGDDPRLASIDPNKGKWIASFTPAAAELGAAGGQLVKNAATGKIGIRAADELCKLKNAAFPNAHMCTNEEVAWNVRMGFIVAGSTGMAIGSHQDPGLSGVRNSFKGNCGGLTYNSADLAYTGTRWEAVASDPKLEAPGNDNVDALAVNFVGGVSCTAVAPIACCQ